MTPDEVRQIRDFHDSIVGRSRELQKKLDDMSPRDRAVLILSQIASAGRSRKRHTSNRHTSRRRSLRAPLAKARFRSKASPAFRWPLRRKP